MEADDLRRQQWLLQVDMPRIGIVKPWVIFELFEFVTNQQPVILNVILHLHFFVGHIKTIITLIIGR